MNQKQRDLIIQYPLFNSLNDEELDELMSLVFETSYYPQEIIVTQGQIVDALYLISEGEAEVATTQPDGSLVPIAILKEGDAIGLNAAGFFSESGERKATLTAITDIHLIGWKIDAFHNFLKAHPHFRSSMIQSSEIILRMNFIKQAECFSNLSVDKILTLAKQIEEIVVPEGTILFHQGEEGDNAYLVCSGKVEILLVQQDGSEKKLAVIKPFSLFGELAILTKSLRNATARMMERGKLLVLKSDQLQELMNHQSTFDSIMSLVVDRCRPIRKEYIEIYHTKTQGDEALTILKDPIHGHYFKLSEDGWCLWQQLDGTKNLQELMVEVFKTSPNFNLARIADTLFNLADAGFIFLPDVELTPKPAVIEELNFYDKIKLLFKKMAYLNFTFKDVDKIFGFFYRYLGVLYKPFGKFLTVALIFLGLIACVLYLPYAIAEMQSTYHFIAILGAIFFTYLISVLFHELGHGLATKYFNRQVNFFGLRIIWFGLGVVFFVDTSDMWLSDARSRVIVALAGSYTDLLVAGIIVLVAWVTPQADIALFLYLLSLVIYYSVYKNLNPIIENDGYAMLKEIFHDSNLIKNSYRKLSLLRHFNGWKENPTVLIYWSICLFFLMVGLLIAFLFQHYLRLLFPTIGGISSFPLFWILPSLVILRFFMIVRAQFKIFSK